MIRKYSLVEDIDRYQNTLKYATSKLNYSVGEKLYMMPSNMILRSLNEVVKGYNDKIMINNSGLKIGPHVEKVKPPPPHPKDLPRVNTKVFLKSKKQEYTGDQKRNLAIGTIVIARSAIALYYLIKKEKVFKKVEKFDAPKKTSTVRERGVCGNWEKNAPCAEMYGVYGLKKVKKPSKITKK